MRPARSCTLVCGLDGTLDVLHGYDSKKKDITRNYFSNLGNRNMWCYGSILPVVSPCLVEGKKTCSMEIAEQLCWDVPGRILAPVGDGCIISSVYKAFYDMLKLGLADGIPRIMGVQAKGASPI